VCLVAEVSKFLKNVDANPFDGDFIVIMVSKLSYLRVVDDDFAVAEHTGFERRDAGPVGIDCAVMTEDAAYLFFSGVDAVAEGDWLFGADIASEPKRVRQRHT
jgi:hypothetical protein